MQKSAAAARRDVVCAAADIMRVVMRVPRQHERDFQVLLVAMLVFRMIRDAGDEGEGSESIAVLGSLVPARLRAPQLCGIGEPLRARIQNNSGLAQGPAGTFRGNL